MASGDNRQPRQPHNLHGLFKFAMEATKSEDAPERSGFHEMDPERRKFLEEALKSIQVDVISEMEKAVKTLMADDSDANDKANALEVVRDFTENIDMANDFCKIGGLCIVVPNLNSPSELVRASTCSLVAELAQNNPFGQLQLMELNILPRLIELLSDKTPKVRHAALHSISCMVRHFPANLDRFIEHGGLECVLGCVQSSDEKIAFKSAFLLSALSSENSVVRQKFIELNGVERVISVVQPLQVDYDVKLDTQLSALNILTDCPEGLARCRNNEESKLLTAKLKEVLKLCGGKDDCQDQIEKCEQLLKKCSSDSRKQSTDR